MDRRDLIRGILAGMALSAVPRTGFSASNIQGDGPRILFQGDSITDASRNRDISEPNLPKGLGSGYVMLAAASLLGENPQRNFEIYNRGISGNKVYQLAERWQSDALDIQPDVLSILIGVNDYWHTLSHNYKGTVDTYEKDLSELLDKTISALPGVHIIIGEPFYVKGGKSVNGQWDREFPAFRTAALRVAKNFKTTFIPYQSWFDEALEIAPVNYWCPDGVHPSLAGAQLMATAWLDAFRSI